MTQTIRCYSPADFLLLLQDTGLRVDLIESLEREGEQIDLAAGLAPDGQRFAQERSYLTRLVRV